MPGAPVETLPGGLLDHLVRTGPAPAAAAHCLAGAWAAAAAVGLVPEPTPTDLAWQGLGLHGALLTLPDGAALTLDHATARIADLRWETPTAGAPAATVAECRVLDGVLALRTVRSLLPPHALDAASIGGDPLSSGLARLRRLHRRVVPVRPDLAGHLALLGVDLRRRAGRGGDAAHRRAVTRLGQAGDVSGLACAELLRGDASLARFSSPLLWDCLPVPGTGPGSGLLDRVEALEMGGAGAPDPDAAAAAYQRADGLYRDAGHAWGRATVGHRRALLALQVDGPATAAGHLSAAAEALAAAGDRGGAVLAGLHAALAGLAADDLPERPATAAAIAAWWQGDGGPAPGTALAALVTRVGRHWLDTAPERAAAAFRIAEAVHTATGAHGARSQSLVDQAAAAAVLGDRSAERLLVLQALEALDAATTTPTPGWGVPVTTATAQARQQLLALQLYTVGLATGDAPAVQRAAGLLGSDVGAAEEPVTVLDHESEVMALLLRGQQARDTGEDAVAQECFRAAAALADAAPANQRDLLHAYVAGYRRDLPTATAAFRRHLSTRLADVEAWLDRLTGEVTGSVGTGTGAGTDDAALPAATRRALVLEQTRMLRLQAMAFFLRVHRPTDAREQLTALQGLADPWWAGLGPDWENASLVGRLQELEGDLDGAAATLDAAVVATAAIRARLRRDDAKTAFAGEPAVQDLHRAAARVALRRRAAALAAGDTGAATAHAAEAVRLAEGARSRALLDMLAANVEGDAELVEAVPRWRAATAARRAAQDRWHALVATEADPSAVAAARRSLEAAEGTLADLEDDLRSHAPGFWASVSPEVRTGTLEEAAAVLPPGTVVLQYSVDQPDLLGWALTRDGMVAATWDEDQRRLRPAVTKLLRGYVDGTPEPALGGLADEVAATLLAPFAPALDAAERIVVVGSGPTLRLPFAALPWHGAPLGLDRTVATLPSLSALRYLAPVVGHPGPRAAPAPGAPDSAPLVVGDPRAMALDGPAGPRPQPPLPAAALEARYVAGLLPGARLLLGADASESAVRSALPTARLVHLATHGVLDATAPLDSAVLLADGMALTAAELVGLRLDADLVVLSACHSGEGPVVGGDDVLGLGRGLLAAGARSALLTLWSIDDVSGALLMGELHRRRQAGDGTATALRHAMGWLRGLDRGAADDALAELRDAVLDRAEPAAAAEVDRLRGITRRVAAPAPFSHPRHWAPYVLVGAPW